MQDKGSREEFDFLWWFYATLLCQPLFMFSFLLYSMFACKFVYHTKTFNSGIQHTYSSLLFEEIKYPMDILMKLCSISLGKCFSSSKLIEQTQAYLGRQIKGSRNLMNPSTSKHIVLLTQTSEAVWINAYSVQTKLPLSTNPSLLPLHVHQYLQGPMADYSQCRNMNVYKHKCSSRKRQLIIIFQSKFVPLILQRSFENTSLS